MTKQKQKSKKKNKELKIAMIFLGVLILIITFFIAKDRFDEYNDKTAMEQTLTDVSGLYNGFVAATPEQEELAYKPENTCAYKSGLWAGYVCQVKGSIRYSSENGDLERYFQHINQVIDLNTFSITRKGSPQNYENQLYQSYEIKDKKTQIDCKIFGSYQDGKTRLTFLCKKDSNFQLYAFEDARKDERLYSE